MKKIMVIALGFLFLNTASASFVENVGVPSDVQQHVNYITKNCEVQTHLTERIKEDELAGGIVTDRLRNIDRIVRSCDGGSFGASRAVWDKYHAYHFNLENTGQMLPVFTDNEYQAAEFVRTGRFYWVAK